MTCDRITGFLQSRRLGLLGAFLSVAAMGSSVFAQRINGPDPGYRGGATTGRGGIYSPGTPAPVTNGYTFVAPQFRQQVQYGPPVFYGNPYLAGQRGPTFSPGYSSTYFWNPNAGYGMGYSGYGQGGMIGNGGFITPRTIITQQVSPGVYSPVPNHDLARSGVASRPVDPLQQDLLKLNEDLAAGARFADPLLRPIRISTLESKRAAIQARSDGDLHMLRQEWNAAYVDYDKAVASADDDAENHYRRAIALTKLRQFDQAVTSMKRALHVDPGLPKTAPGIPVIFGPENQLARLSLIQGLGSWVEQDIRDPNRLYLMGTILYFNDDPRYREFLDAVVRLGENGPHVAAFLLNDKVQMAAKPTLPLPMSVPLSPVPAPLGQAPAAGTQGPAAAPEAPLPEAPLPGPAPASGAAPKSGLPPLQTVPGQLVPKGPST